MTITEAMTNNGRMSTKDLQNKVAALSFHSWSNTVAENIDLRAAEATLKLRGRSKKVQR